MPRQRYESWRNYDGTEITFATTERVEELKLSGEISEEHVLEYTVDAWTSEEASAIHYLRQGFEPYKPIGDKRRCPKCDAWFFPLGSGDCWKCSMANHGTSSAGQSDNADLEMS